MVVEVAAAVTPCRHDAGPTVLDERWEPSARGSAAGLGGDVAGTNQITVPLEAAVPTAEPAALGLGNALPADRAGGGGVTLVHQPHHDACQLGLVPQGLQQVGAAPLPQAEVLHPTGVPAGNALGIAHHQGADTLPDSEGDDLLGGLMLGLVDTAAMPGLGPPHARPVVAPTPRPAPPWSWCPSGGLGLAGLLGAQVQVSLGANRPARN